MLSFFLYVISVVVGLLLYFFYEPESSGGAEGGAEQEGGDKAPGGAAWGGEEGTSRPSPRRCAKLRFDWQLSSLCAVLGLSAPGGGAKGGCEEEVFESFSERFRQFSEVSEACARAGLESCSLVLGVDFTASNEWKGRKSFGQSCLHKVVGNKVSNPYQKVLWVLGQALAPLASDHHIHAYGFGDSETKGGAVFPLRADDAPCRGAQEVLDCYNEVVRRVALSGPSSLAPIIQRAVELVQLTSSYHILVIVTDGQVTEEAESLEAIVAASNHALSIIAVGVGDGPWAALERFDGRVAHRKFDNFRLAYEIL